MGEFDGKDLDIARKVGIEVVVWAARQMKKFRKRPEAISLRAGSVMWM